MASYHISPIGELVHPWINKPDTKYNAEGIYKADLRVAGQAAETLASKIEQAAKSAFAQHVQEMKPAEAKKWSLYVPFEREEDDEGNPTGAIIFTFKQNAKIPSKKEASGFKDVKIELRDSQDEVIDVQVFGGSEGRVMFSMREIAVASSRQAGVRLDFAKVQITKLKTGGGAAQGFGAVEGGFVAESEERGFGNAPQDDQPDETGGDY